MSDVSVVSVSDCSASTAHAMRDPGWRRAAATASAGSPGSGSGSAGRSVGSAGSARRLRRVSGAMRDTVGRGPYGVLVLLTLRGLRASTRLTGWARQSAEKIHPEPYGTCLLYTSPSPRDGLLY